MIQHAVELHMVLAVQIQGDSQHRLATRIQQGDLVAINLIAGRLAAAGEGAEAGLIGLEVQGHQAVAAHIDRQLTVQGLAGPALLQADAGV
ncbi:hypothetical protein D3C76_1092230 [compost metagenome]